MEGQTMRFALLVASIFTVAAAIVTREMREREFFRHLEAIDVDGITNNQRLVDKYIKCLLKTGKCDPAMKDLRISLPLILEHMCETRCSERERTNLRKLFMYIRTNRPLEWDRLSKLYDPKGTYKPRVDAFVENRPRISTTTQLPTINRSTTILPSPR
uniref:Chemosensory protein 12 n=1 Tax=Cyrtorhinus lividipennis TaxID=1032904 RepID=A0A346TI08_9HEMI|nr:chemosensory protein 12 [Cyrtorhinus lividipennis]